MGYTVHGLLQARILDWISFPFSRGSSWPRDLTQVSCIAGRIYYQLSCQGSPRILEWVAYPFFSGSSLPRNQTGISCIAGRFFTNWAIREFVYMQIHKICIDNFKEIILNVMFYRIMNFSLDKCQKPFHVNVSKHSLHKVLYVFSYNLKIHLYPKVLFLLWRKAINFGIFIL